MSGIGAQRLPIAPQWQANADAGSQSYDAQTRNERRANHPCESHRMIFDPPSDLVPDANSEDR